MRLTREKQEELRALYACWGIDAVREDIDRNGSLVPPDIVAFARSWIASEESRQRRSVRRMTVLRASAIGLLAGTLLAQALRQGLLPDS